MKKHLLFANLLIICTLLLQSCAISVNTTKHNEQPWIGNPFDMARTDYRIVKEINAQTQATYVLGIGGWKSRKDNAVEMLLKSVDLKHNQQLVNITHNTFISVIVCGLVVRKVTTAHGYIIETGVTESIAQIDTPKVQETYSIPEKSIQKTTPQKQKSTIKQKEPVVQPEAVEHRSEFEIKTDATLNKAKSLINYYKNSGKHYVVFKTFYKEVEKTPTEANIAELELCYNLLRKYHTDKLDYKNIDTQLKKANDIKAQEKILIEEAKKQANL